MTDEQLGAMWREECAKADHITWAATSFARRVEAAERERCAKERAALVAAAAMFARMVADDSVTIAAITEMAEDIGRVLRA